MVGAEVGDELAEQVAGIASTPESSSNRAREDRAELR